MAIRYPAGTILPQGVPAQSKKRASKAPTEQPDASKGTVLEQRIHALFASHSLTWRVGECRLPNIADHPGRHATKWEAAFNAVVLWHDDVPGVQLLGTAFEVELWSDDMVMQRVLDLIGEKAVCGSDAG